MHAELQRRRFMCDVTESITFIKADVDSHSADAEN